MATQTHEHPAAAVPPMQVYRFTSEQYRGMLHAGTFADERVELLDGWIVPKMTKHRPHTIAQLRTFDALRGVVPDGWHVEQEAPLTISDLSTPEPDLMVVRGRPEDYPDAPARAADVAIVVEVSDSSLHGDRRTKLTHYAASGIPTYWLVNLADRVIEGFMEPSGPTAAPAFGRCTTIAAKDTVPVILGGLEIGRIPARDLLP